MGPRCVQGQALGPLKASEAENVLEEMTKLSVPT